MAGPLRAGIVCDLATEGWPSMDLVAEMLLQHLAANHGDTVRAVPIRPDFARPSPAAVRRWWGLSSARRMVDRYWQYPQWLARRRDDFDVFHVVDHSYAHLVHVLPADRTVVSCHDVDAFRSLFDPSSRDSRLPRFVVRRVFEGLRRAALVACASEWTRRELVATGEVDERRTVVVPNGTEPSCTPEHDPEAEAEAGRLIGPESADSPELLHVGTTIARKRIDVLLEVFAEVRRAAPGARLLRAGGPFTREQQNLAGRLGILPHVVVLPFLPRPVLSAVYRRAALVLQPSEREGFGLPVVEAMACGTPVVASDLPVLREVGGDAASYCRLADVPAWRDQVLALLDERRLDPVCWTARVRRGLEWAARFSWREHTAAMVKIYLELAGRSGLTGEDSRNHGDTET